MLAHGCGLAVSRGDSELRRPLVSPRSSDFQGFLNLYCSYTAHMLLARGRGVVLMPRSKWINRKGKEGTSSIGIGEEGKRCDSARIEWLQGSSQGCKRPRGLAYGTNPLSGPGIRALRSPRRPKRGSACLSYQIYHAPHDTSSLVALSRISNSRSPAEYAIVLKS